MGMYVVYVFAFIVIYLNFLSTISLFKTNELSRYQKLGQFIFVWTLPIIGSRFVLRILAENEDESIKWIPQRGHGWLITPVSYFGGDGSDSDGGNYSDGGGDGGGGD